MTTPAKRFFSPPQDLIATPKQQLSTPTKAAIRGVVYYSEINNVPYSTSKLAKTFGTSETTVKRVLRDTSRTIGKGPDREPCPRHHPVEFTPNEARAIGDWLDQANFNKNSLPWKDMAYEAGVQTDMHTRTIQRHMKADQSIVTRSAPDKELLPPEIQ